MRMLRALVSRDRVLSQLKMRTQVSFVSCVNLVVKICMAGKLHNPLQPHDSEWKRILRNKMMGDGQIWRVQ
jgi:hypothetical protein